MRHILLLLALCIVLPVHAASWPANPPKLVLMVVIDQFRADYITRFESKMGKDGFRALIKDGAYFPYGEYDLLQAMTGPGHATVLTGAYPYQMGIPLNDWYDQKTRKVKYCTEDAEFETVGAPTRAHVGTSPRSLIGSTVGDELKNVDRPTFNVSIALKDRASILMGGHRADLAIWFDSGARKWVSSSYYLKSKELPTWVRDLNASFKECELSTPCGIATTADAFTAALKARPANALPFYSVSFSSHDYAGHRHGPNAKEMEAMVLAEDRALASMRAQIDKAVGLKNAVIVLTGDHGVAPSPDYLRDTRILSGSLDEHEYGRKIDAALVAKCGSEKWVGFVEDFNYFLDRGAVARSKCDLAKAQTIAKAVLSEEPAFAYVFTLDEYDRGLLPPGRNRRQIEKTIYPGRSGDVIAMQKPFYVNVSPNKATHMSGYTYDRMVPILFSGRGIKPGVYADRAEVVDIAPTLSFLLGVLPPALSEGTVLKQALK